MPRRTIAQTGHEVMASMPVGQRLQVVLRREDDTSTDALESMGTAPRRPRADEPESGTLQPMTALRCSLSACVLIAPAGWRRPRRGRSRSSWPTTRTSSTASPCARRSGRPTPRTSPRRPSSGPTGRSPATTPKRIRELRPRGWLAAIVGNLGRNRARRKRPGRGRRSRAWPRPAAETRRRPERVVERREAARVWRARLDALPARYRRAVELRHVSGLSYPELAEALDRPLGTVKSDVHRGVQAAARGTHGTDEATRSHEVAR